MRVLANSSPPFAARRSLTDSDLEACRGGNRTLLQLCLAQLTGDTKALAIRDKTE
jgi:hypothetical protein